MRDGRAARPSPRVGRWIPLATAELEEWSSPQNPAGGQGNRIRLMDSFRPGARQHITGGLSLCLTGDPKTWTCRNGQTGTGPHRGPNPPASVPIHMPFSSDPLPIHLQSIYRGTGIWIIPATMKAKIHIGTGTFLFPLFCSSFHAFLKQPSAHSNPTSSSRARIIALTPGIMVFGSIHS